MCGQVERNVCSYCSEVKEVNRKYFYYPNVNCECCSCGEVGTHFEIVWYCKECADKVKPPREIKPVLKRNPRGWCNGVEFKAQAVMSICNTLGVSIMIDESGDYVYYQYSNSEEVFEAEVTHEVTGTIFDNEESRESIAYFYTEEGVQFDLADFIRV